MREFVMPTWAAVFGLSALCLAASPASAATVQGGATSTIVGVNAGLCLGVKGASAASGALLQSQNCSGSDFQSWKFVKDSAGYFELVNAGSGLCIDVTGGSSANGTNLQQWNCSGANHQKWNLSDQGSGQFAIISRHNGLALEVFDASTTNGARVVQWTWAGGSHQKWTVPAATDSGGAGPASGAVITLKGVQAGHCVGVKGASAASGTALQSQACSGSTFQQWKALKDAAGDYELVNAGSGLCMDVPGASSANGAAIQQWGCGGGAWQKWQFHDDQAGHTYITSKASGLALDVAQASKADGAAIIQWTYRGGANQQWVASASGGSTPPAAGGPIGFGAATTGGKGGAVVTVTTPEQLSKALCATTSNSVCTDTTPRIIRVSGLIDFRGTEGNQTSLGCTYSHNNCAVNGKSERILNFASYCSGRATYNITYDAAGKTPLLVGSNKTLIGVGAGSGIKGKGLMLKGGVSNVIVRNLSITDINDGVIWAGDAITLDNASKVWIDHNRIARIGRQMIVTGWGTAQQVTISDNDFDGTSDYGHYCNGKHYWVMLLVAENQTITLSGNRIHNTSGRSPEVGKQSTAASGGIVHVVNNHYDGNYYMGIGASDDAVTLVEGNYFTKANYFFPIMQTATNKVFAPISSNIASANNTCVSVLGRSCVSNYDTNSPKDFILNPAAMSTIQTSSSAVQSIKSVTPREPATVPNQVVGPQNSITE